MAKLNLVQLAGNTYYIPSPTNVGLYVDNGEAVLIDSGNDKEAGRQILRLLNDQGWTLKLIINTHSNADHIGGNAYLQKKTNCMIAATRMESAFINDPVLEAALLYGGFPHGELKNKFLVAKPSRVTSLIASSGVILDTALQAIPLPGHFFDMIGVKTPDNVVFIADSLFPENVINKYQLFFLLDVKSHLNTLDKLQTLNASVFIPGHGDKLQSLDLLIEVNKSKVYEIIAKIKHICEKPVTTYEIMRQLCLEYSVELNPTQYVLVLSTIRSYLSYLHGEKQIEYLFDNGEMIWKR